MAYSRAPVIVNLTDTIEEMRVEVNAITAKLNELFDGSNNHVIGGTGLPAILTSPVLSDGSNVTGTYTLAGTPTITNPTINAATITGTVASTASITGPLNLTGAVLAGASPLVFEAATANDFELTIAVADVTADRTITLPDSSGTVVLVGTTSLAVANGGTIGSLSDLDAITITSAGVVTFSQRDVHTLGITIANGQSIGSVGDVDSITIATAGAVTFSQRTVHSQGISIANGEYIGSASDDNAMQISSAGVVTFSQKGDFSVGIVIGNDTPIGSVGALTAMVIASTGIVTFIDDIIIKNDGTIGSVGDPAAIAIAADGVVSFTDRTHHIQGIKIANGEYIGTATTANAMQISSAGVVTFSQKGDFSLGIVIGNGTPIGSVGALTAMVIASTGIVTFIDDIIIKNVGTIGSVSDPDAITIAAAGAVTFSQRSIHTLGLTIADGQYIGVTSNTNAISISAAGVVAVPGGIDFAGTSNAGGMTSELLDDYEEGLYTATLTPRTSGTITVWSAANQLSYTKIGRLVTISGRIYIYAVASPVGLLDINLPFVSAPAISGQSDIQALDTYTHTVDLTSGTINTFFEIGPAASSAVYIEVFDNVAWVTPAAEVLGLTDAYFHISGSYISAT